MWLWIRPDGTASLEPYGTYGGFRFRVITAPPAPGQQVELAVLAEDYANILALRSIYNHMDLAAYQSLLEQYVLALAPSTGRLVTLDAAGTALGPPYRFASLDNYLAQHAQRADPFLPGAADVPVARWLDQVHRERRLGLRTQPIATQLAKATWLADPPGSRSLYGLTTL